jgi:hypothetical protein
MSEQEIPAVDPIGVKVAALAACDWNHGDIAEAIGLSVEQMRRDYPVQLANVELLDDAYFCASELVKKLRGEIVAGTHVKMPRHVFNESAKMVIKTLEAKGNWNAKPQEKEIDLDPKDPKVAKVLSDAGALLG